MVLVGCTWTLGDKIVLKLNGDSPVKSRSILSYTFGGTKFTAHSQVQHTTPAQVQGRYSALQRMRSSRKNQRALINEVKYLMDERTGRSIDSVSDSDWSRTSIIAETKDSLIKGVPDSKYLSNCSFSLTTIIAKADALFPTPTPTTLPSYPSPFKLCLPHPLSLHPHLPASL